MASAALDSLPGFRRRMRVEPGQGAVRAAVEDDYHCMHVVLHHDGARIASVDAAMERAPWTTCPSAPDQLRETFVGAELAEVAARGQKQANCTHLYDLALLAAAHAGDAGPTTYDMLISDPVEGRNRAEIRRDGSAVMGWTVDKGEIVEPVAIAGIPLMKMRPWIETLEPADREAARLLQWATIIAHGRAIPLENQSDASRIPPNCYTFQPHRAVHAVRVGEIIDFSATARRPLEQI